MLLRKDDTHFENPRIWVRAHYLTLRVTGDIILDSWEAQAQAESFFSISARGGQGRDHSLEGVSEKRSILPSVFVFFFHYSFSHFHAAGTALS